MRTATIVSVKENKQLELPPEFLGGLKLADLYSVWMSEDGIFISIKKIYDTLQSNGNLEIDSSLWHVGIEKAGEIKFPEIITEKLQPNNEYLITQLSKDDISLEKIKGMSGLDELFNQMDMIGDNLEDVSMAEICEIVKEVRHERAQMIYLF